MATPENIINVANLADFQSLIAKHSHVVIQATASWCGPCRAITPLYYKHATALASKNMAFARFDIDLDSSLCTELGITSVPAFICFENSSPVERVTGASPQGLQKAVEGLAAKAGDKA